MKTAVLKNNPPGPRNALLLWIPRPDPLKFISGLASQYGDIVFFQRGTQRVYLLSDVGNIKDLLLTSAHKFAPGRAMEGARPILGQGLFTSEGEFHLRQRRLLQPAFHRQQVSGYAESMVRFSTRLRDSWHAGQTVDMHRAMTILALHIIGQTLFDADMETDSSEVMEAMAAAFSLFQLLVLPFSELLENVPFSPLRKLHRARARLDAILYRLISERRRSGQDRGDLLSILLHTHKVETDGTRMSDVQIRDQCVTFFLVGHETTANLLTWVWYLLAQHPDVEARLHTEIDAVLGGRPPTMNDIEKLTYTEKVLAETLRMYPPVWCIERRAIDNHQFGPYTIPSRALVIASPWIVQHDPRHFPDPFRFDPERWTSEARCTRHKFSFFPFAAGPRQCLGEGFAWTEATLVLATIAQKWKPELVPGQIIRTKARITLRPNRPVMMTLRAR